MLVFLLLLLLLLLFLSLLLLTLLLFIFITMHILLIMFNTIAKIVVCIVPVDVGTHVAIDGEEQREDYRFDLCCRSEKVMTKYLPRSGYSREVSGVFRFGLRIGVPDVQVWV